MQQVGPTRAIAVAPIPPEMVGQVPAGANGYSFLTPVPQYFQASHFPMPQGGIGGRAGGTRSGVCASRHMAAEQRRRARINERLEALRTLVPHSARANTASFLMEVFEYITALHKQLERLSGGIDLNVTARDAGADVHHRVGGPKFSYPVTPGQSSLDGRTLSARKRTRDDIEQSEEVESQGQPSWGWNGEGHEDENFQGTISAPSLFDSAKDSGPHNSPPRRGLSPIMTSVVPDALTLRTHLPSDARSAFSPAVPLATMTAHVAEDHDMCDTRMTLAIGSSAASSLHSGRLSPASSSHGMPSHDMYLQQSVSAQVSEHSPEASSRVNAWGLGVSSSAPAPAPGPNLPAKKRRRSTATDTCGAFVRTIQGVHRPIALKPQF
eukprot:TRINITY_DN7118_c0_g1_i1.p1 TRINITY_DN7118_c0_g1~~TRINITY_DN7118_c0_g1_i1.p1  ORF type:complete len:381 (-),score=54.41 TRINITY_DN7118_c0_g1_i1:842-1984(-)